ncbi:MAG: SDR family NAD(P)-dependent oxidoreductase, partial [Elainellaceae cyanobacterium]
MTRFDPAALPPQTGKIAIVTGANTGIGYETALALAKTGMTVSLACRNQAKAIQARDSILAQVPEGDVVVMPLDLSELSSVRAFAQAYRERFSHLDLLINNAGVMCPPYSKTEDGFERQMGVNYLGHFLLTELLLDLMPDTSQSRVVSLSSNAHK